MLLGAGGGYDIYGSFFLYKKLKKAGIKVHLANYSFTDDLYNLDPDNNFIIPVTKDTPRTSKQLEYFPEYYLSTYLSNNGINNGADNKVDNQAELSLSSNSDTKLTEEIPIHTIRLVPPQHLYKACLGLIKKLEITKIICIDAGCDCILFGDEGKSRGSPLEDMSMILTVSRLLQMNIIKAAFVSCISITTENLPLETFLNHVSVMTREGGFIGCENIPYDKDFHELLDTIPFSTRSIPMETTLASQQGYFGKYENPRLLGRISDNFPDVSPLTSMYWYFDIKKLVECSSLLQYLLKVVNFEKITTTDNSLEKDAIYFNQLINGYYQSMENI